MVSSDTVKGDDLEREVYLVRRMAAKQLVDKGFDWRADMYICSLSSRTIVYKGMTNADALGMFFKDLTDPEYAANFCVYHRRFRYDARSLFPPLCDSHHSGMCKGYIVFFQGLCCLPYALPSCC